MRDSATKTIPQPQSYLISSLNPYSRSPLPAPRRRWSPLRLRRASRPPWCAPEVPRYAVRTTRLRLVRVRCTYGSPLPRGKLPCASGTRGKHKAGTRSPYVTVRTPGTHCQHRQCLAVRRAPIPPGRPRDILQEGRAGAAQPRRRYPCEAAEGRVAREQNQDASPHGLPRTREFSWNARGARLRTYQLSR